MWRLLLLSFWIIAGDYDAEEFLDCGGEVFLVLEPVKDVHVGPGVAVCVGSGHVEASVSVVFILGQVLFHGCHFFGGAGGPRLGGLLGVD